MSEGRPPAGVPRSPPAGPAGGVGGAGRGVLVGLIGSAALVAAVTLAARVTGFGRWLVFHGQVGADCVGEAYATANQLPNVLYEVVAGGALAAAVVPLLAGPLSRGDRAEASRTASALLTWAVTLLLPVAVVTALLARPVAGALLGGEECSAQQALAARMLVVFAPQVVLYGVGVVLTGVLQAQHRFLWPAAAPLLSSLVVIAAYLGYGTLTDAGVEPAGLGAAPEALLTWGTTAGVAALTLPLLVPVLRGGTRLRPTWRFPAGVARRAAALSAAGVVTLLAQQAAVVVTLLLANRAGPTGSWPVFQYVQAVYLLPYAVLAVPLATVAFPRLAEQAARGDAGAFAATAARTTRAVLLVAFLGAAVLAGTAPAVTAVFAAIGRGGDVTPMQAALVAIAPGLVGFALVAHVGRALNALHRPRAAALATAAGWAAVAAGSAAAVAAAPAPQATVPALGAGMSLGMTVAGGLLLLALRRAAGPEAVTGVARTLLAAGAAAVVGALAGRAVAGLVLDDSVAGDGLAGALAAGAAGALVAAGLLAAVVAVLDSSTASVAAGMLRRRAPGPGRGGGRRKGAGR